MTLTNAMERALMTWERKIMKKIYGPAYEYGYWGIKLNQEIYNKFKSPDIMTVIKVQRLEWCGHVVRMDGDRTVSMLVEGKPGGRGETWIKCMDDVELDLTYMGLKS
jgi:hypothetical protein